MLDRFGQKLKKVREARKMSQRDLGMFLGLSDKAISSYESGRTLPTLETLVKVSKELEKPISYFLDDNFAHESLIDRMNEIELELKHVSENLQEIRKILSEKDKDSKIDIPYLTPEA